MAHSLLPWLLWRALASFLLTPSVFSRGLSTIRGNQKGEGHSSKSRELFGPGHRDGRWSSSTTLSGDRLYSTHVLQTWCRDILEPQQHAHPRSKALYHLGPKGREPDTAFQSSSW